MRCDSAISGVAAHRDREDVVSEKQLPRVTYSNIAEDFAPVHAHLDALIPRVKAGLTRTVRPNVIGGREDSDGKEYAASSPIDRDVALGTFVEASPAAIDRAVAAARAAAPAWRTLGWRKRLEILGRAAEEIARRKYELSVICLIEVGKSRMEAVGEIEESIDLIRYYCGQMADHNGYAHEMRRAFPNERAEVVLRPHGVFAVISPFNFPVALSIGMMTGALVGGNTVVFKPSPMAGLTGHLVFECLHAAGLPDGVVNIVCGGAEPGARLASHPGIDGVAFTGSHAVGMEIFRKAAQRRFAIPVLAEMGGKNAAYVTAKADLATAASGVMRSAFGLQGQKCSSCSKVYVEDEVYDDFMDRLLALTAKIEIGNPEEQRVYMGPVINKAAAERFAAAADSVRQQGAFAAGGEILSGGLFDRGYYVQPSIAIDLPQDHALFREEKFLPLLAVRRFRDLSAAIADSNGGDYGLTAGIYTRDESELALFLDRAEAGVLYANRASGATTGAWPGIQTFCGWKGSGLTGKGGLGPWYVPQFMREQSHTVME
jgi:1-pyrroline-5-carboxylate dehydrogenase